MSAARSNPLVKLGGPARLPMLAMLAMICLIAGCAGTGSKLSGDATDSKPTIAAEDRARVEVDGELGFTVTEVVRINGDVRADYQDALRLLQQERYDAGITLLVEVAARAPDLTAPHINLGVAYRLSGDPELAEVSLQSALQLAPNHPVALNEMGILYRQTGRFEAARRSYEQALAVHPGFHYALMNLGILCDLFLDDLSCALEQYEAYSEIDPNDQTVAMWAADIRTRISTVQ